MVLGGGRGRFDINRPHGSVYYSVGELGSGCRSLCSHRQSVRAKPATCGSASASSLGGPLNIPDIYKGGSKTFFFVNYNGSRGIRPMMLFPLSPASPSAAAIFQECREFS